MAWHIVHSFISAIASHCLCGIPVICADITVGSGLEYHHCAICCDSNTIITIEWRYWLLMCSTPCILAAATECTVHLQYSTYNSQAKITTQPVIVLPRCLLCLHHNVLSDTRWLPVSDVTPLHGILLSLMAKTLCCLHWCDSVHV